MRNKGIMRIIEVIIASIILLAAVSFFLPSGIKSSEWSSSFVQTRAYDALVAIDRNSMLDMYVDNNMSAEMYNNLSQMLPLQVDFAIKISRADGSKYDMCCAYSEECCKNMSIVRNFIEIPYVAEGYKVNLLIWNIYY
ncbi:MAG: hypothetical protein HZB67_04100 [Candidatus Aenigmarchaeota archaeon]|nr:hypothetical protein [Candidatus Aenigmarchaeota archaeon]